MTYCNVNGQLVRAEDAVVSVQDRGFRFGDGVFETIRVQAGVPCWFEWHMQRLAGGLRALRIDFDTASLTGLCRELLRKNAIVDGLLRIQVTRGSGSRGYLPTPSNAHYVIETPPFPVIPDKPGALWMSSHTKISPRALPVQYKLCQGLNSTLARMEAAEHDCMDALLLNENGQICETSSGNIFWLADGTLYTPSLACGVLEGATRAAIMRLSAAVEVEAPVEALRGAQAIFITNAVWRTLAVGAIPQLGISCDSHAYAQQVKRLLDEDCADYCQKQAGAWG